jgi:aminopeptidase N
MVQCLLMSKKAKRLYEGFQPEHYELILHPDAQNLRFNGTVVMTGKKTGRPSKRITLHQKDLKITSAAVQYHGKRGDEIINLDRTNTHSAYDELRLHSQQMLYPGSYTIRLEFNGVITPELKGIYPANYKHKGKDKRIIITQLESHHAREAFPCIDEPEAKATFKLTVTAPEHETVLSNTPEESHKKIGKLVAHTFEQTPKMSTYLLAFAMGELHYSEAISKAGIAVRSWATIAQPKERLEYATQEAAKILDFFANYFGVPYPLKKLDQIAVPDFEAGAMENWGMVTYREVILLIDSKNRSISSEQFATQVIAHELSHQWFGNLVTMKWWDDLWLNESFAGLMEHVPPAALHPDWQQWELYTAQDIPLITSRDSYKDIQPVGVPVTDPDLISTVFDPAIVYAKGARLIKMLKEYTGEEAFIKGLGAYFAKHAYGNASRDDLWEALSKTSGKDIKALMTPWLVQPGMPVIHVSQGKKKLSVSQERFLLDGKPDGTIWPIPLLSDTTSETPLIDTPVKEIALPSSTYVVVNPNASGQFITHYINDKHREFIARALIAQKISTEARINIFNDLYMLARHGDVSLTDGLDMAIRNTHEPRDSVWGMMARALAAAAQLTEDDKQSEKKLKFLRIAFAQKWYQKLGWDDSPKDDPNTKQLRHTMVSLMISGEDSAAIKEALARYKLAKNDLQSLQAELRSAILAAAVRHGKPGIINELLEKYDTASPDVQMDITSALSSTKEPAAAKVILSKALGAKGFVRSQDVMRWLALFLRNHHVRSVAWEYMVKDWGWLEETLKSSKSFDYLPVYAASIIASEQWAKKYHALFEPKLNDKLLERNIKIGFADIAARIAWRKRDEAAIKKWLVENTKVQLRNS